VGRQTRAFGAALALHGLAWALLALVRVPATVSVASSRVIELAFSEAPRPPAPPPPVVTAIAPPPRQRSRPRVTATTTPPEPLTMAQPRAIEPPAIEPPAAPTTSPLQMRPSTEPGKGPSGPPELFPRGVLQELAAKNLGPPPGPPRRKDRDNDRDRDTPGGWLDDAAAEARTRAGQVNPVWRDIERALVQTFKPPIDVVHDVPRRTIDRIGDRLRSFTNQAAGVVARGEEGLRRPVEPGAHDLGFSAGGYIDPSQQGFQGLPEGLNYRSMPLQQQQAVAAATAEPARWLAVEIEITVDGAGKVTRARVAFPSGRRAFDRYALRLIEEHVAKAMPPSSLSRWLCKAGYAVSRPDAIGIDVLKLFSRKTIKDSLLYPLKDRVEAQVSLKWVKEMK
jgi:TonB family protein